MFRALMEPDLLNGNDIMVDLADLAPAFTFVIGKDFETSVSDYRPQEFGNATLEMAGAQFSLRFERDRGQIFVDAGNKAVGWYKLEYVLEFVDNSLTQQQLGEPPELVVIADLLQMNWDKVANLFDDEQRISQLQEFSKQKSATLLGRLFHNS